MTKEERLELMAGGPSKEYYPRHCQVATEVLDRLATELSRQDLKYEDDYSWPYHLLVPSNGRYISLFCGGFRESIDVQQMRKNGTADARFKERRFATVKGVVNYLKRGWK